MHIDRRLALLSPVAALPFLSKPNTSPAAALESMGEPLLLSSFGAKLDGSSDDSVALQRAFDACAVRGPARPLVIDGPCRVERSVFIDRPVDKTRGVLRVSGRGAFGGFLAAGDFPIIESRIGHPSAPSNEHIWFENVRFEATQSNSKATCLSDKFLRVRFIACEFERIRALSGGKYAQEWQFTHCTAQRWNGVFFSSRGGYHITSTAGKYQNGGGNVFEIVDPFLKDSGCVGCSFHQDIVESTTGSFLKAAIVQGLSVSGLYSEGNYGTTLNFDSTAPNRGVSVSGCMFAPQDERKLDPTFYDIRWGFIEAGSSSGNYCTARLHHYKTPNAAALTVAGDYAALELINHDV